MLKGGESLLACERKLLTLAITIGLIAGLFMFSVPSALATDPSGANVSKNTDEHIITDTATSDDAYAGNVSEITLKGYSLTQTWQGYYGNVTGVIELGDALNNTLYNWTVASPQGEVYASTNQSITWSNIQCFNFTADGTMDPSGEVAGSINLKGTNLSLLEETFNINQTNGVDGIDETFSDAIDHDAFYTASREFSSGECLATRTFDNTGSATNSLFEEVLLYEPSTASVVFAAILEEDADGFDDGTHDFQMLVLEDGHGTDTSTTDYYFFVELE